MAKTNVKTSPKIKAQVTTKTKTSGVPKGGADLVKNVK